MRAYFSKAVISGVIYAFFMFLFLPHLNAYTEDIDNVLYDSEVTISMDLQNANLKDVLKIFSIQSGLNFIASEGVQDRKVTLYMDKVALEDAMNQLFKANNLSYELDKDANIFIVKDWGKTAVETVTRVFYLKYATVSSSALEKDVEDYLATNTEGAITSASSSSSSSSSSSGSSDSSGSESSSDEEDNGITNAVKKLLSTDIGKVIEDPRTNSLIVTDSPNRMQTIASVIAALDIPQPQIMLEVEMLDVDKNNVDKIGLNWAAAGSFAMTVVSAARMTGFPLGQVGHMGQGVSRVSTTGTVGGTTAKYAAGEINFPTNLKWVFDFLRTQTDTKILARPRIMTLSNRTAEIQIVTNESIGTITASTSGGALTSQSVEAERSITGVALRVTPQVNGESGEITMFLYPAVRNAVASTTFNGTTAIVPTYKDPASRTTKQVVRIKDGDTVILGGLIRRETSETITKLPFLGDVPLMGNLFRHKYKDKDQERELLVFITPHIIKEADMKLAKAANTSLPEREQSAASEANRESLINANLSRFEKKKK